MPLFIVSFIVTGFYPSSYIVRCPECHSAYNDFSSYYPEYHSGFFVRCSERQIRDLFLLPPSYYLSITWILLSYFPSASLISSFPSSVSFFCMRLMRLLILSNPIRYLSISYKVSPKFQSLTLHILIYFLFYLVRPFLGTIWDHF